MITLITLTVAAITVTAFSATPTISHNVHCVKLETENTGSGVARYFEKGVQTE